jgi:hypothetical protein
MLQIGNLCFSRLLARVISGIMILQAIVSSMERGYLSGDTSALALAAVDLAILTPRGSLAVTAESGK